MTDKPSDTERGRRRALFIDSTARTVTEIGIDSLEDLQKQVGGFIETAWAWANGDVLFVDEEGLLKPQEHFFLLPNERPDQAFAGNGVLVGREIEGRHYPDGYTTLPPRHSAADLTAKIVWASRDAVRSRFGRA